MKRTFLLIPLIVASIACSTSSLWALPVVNTAGDAIEDLGGTPYAYYVNSGELMFVADGNKLGNARSQ